MPLCANRALAAFAAGLGLLLLAQPARACAACGCGDPSVSEIGIPDTDKGGVIAGITTAARQDEIGGETQSQASASAVLFWTATSELQLYLRMPWVARGVGTESASGMGDLALGDYLVLWRERGLSRGQSVMLQTELSLPTGLHQGDNLDLMPGTGAATAQLGLSWFGHHRGWRAYASAAYKKTLIPAPDYTPGDVTFANAGLQHALDLERLDWTLEANAKDEARSRWPLGVPVDDTGGRLVYLTPGILASMGSVESRWFLRASAQIPLYYDLIGRQTPGPVIQAGLFRSF